MATAQLIKNETDTSNLSPFSDIKTEEWEKSVIKGATISSVDSLLVNKRLIAAAFSSILYYRKVMPSVRFKSRKLDGLQFKVISDDNFQPNGDTQTVLSWIKSAFDAFEKGYLRRWLISVHPLEDENKTLETYIFHFKYKDGIKNMQLDHGMDRHQESIMGQNMRDKLRNILDSSIRLTNSLPPIRNNVFVTSRFLYYDNVTPQDYEPEGFQPNPIEGSLDFIGVPLQLNLGRVDSPFHIIKLTSCINQQNINALDQDDRQKWISNIDKYNSTVVSSQKIDPEEFHIMDINCQTQNILPSETAKCSSGEESKILANCLCQRPEMDSFMLYCVVCLSWQHAPCYGRLKNTNIPKQHICLHCHNPSEGFICSDPTLVQFQDNPRILKNMTLLRQCLKLAYDSFEDVIFAEYVSVTIGVDLQWVINSFSAQNLVLTQSPDVPTLFKINKSEFLRIIVPKYFLEDEVIDLNESGPLIVLNEGNIRNNEIKETAEKNITIEEQINETSMPNNDDIIIIETKKNDFSKTETMKNKKEIKTDFVVEGKPPKKKTRYSLRRKN